MNNGINSTFDSRKHTVHRVAERVLVNRNYDDEILEYDIALVQIKQCDEGKCYKFSTHIRPIALPQSELCQKQKKKRKSNKSKVFFIILKSEIMIIGFGLLKTSFILFTKYVCYSKNAN